MLPTLNALANGLETPLREIRVRVATAENLTPEELSEKLSSGHGKFANRVSWALLGIERARLVERVRRGVYLLTSEGDQLLKQQPEHIDDNVLQNYPAFVAWKNEIRQKTQPTNGASAREDESKETLEETLERVANELRTVLESEVLNRVRNAPPDFLEQVVIELLVAMGYGGGDATKGYVTGGPGDGGIDDRIKEDALGLDEVPIQAKRYGDGKTVGRDHVSRFAGALDNEGTSKGVFVTTAKFTPAAETFVRESPKRIVLIDGDKLANLMVQYGIGIRTDTRYEIKRIDEHYFEQEDL